MHRVERLFISAPFFFFVRHIFFVIKCLIVEALAQLCLCFLVISSQLARSLSLSLLLFFSLSFSLSLSLSLTRWHTHTQARSRQCGLSCYMVFVAFSILFACSHMLIKSKKSSSSNSNNSKPKPLRYIWKQRTNARTYVLCIVWLQIDTIKKAMNVSHMHTAAGKINEQRIDERHISCKLTMPLCGKCN